MEYRVHAYWLAQAQTEQALRGYPDKVIPEHRSRGGNLKTPDGHIGPWLLAHDPAKDEIELGIAWICPAATEGVIRYTAFSRMPNPGEPSWDTAVLNLAVRFRCVAHGE